MIVRKDCVYGALDILYQKRWMCLGQPGSSVSNILDTYGKSNYWQILGIPFGTLVSNVICSQHTITE